MNGDDYSNDLVMTLVSFVLYNLLYTRIVSRSLFKIFTKDLSTKDVYVFPYDH